MLSLNACIVEDNRCSAHQVRAADNTFYSCVCASGYVVSSEGYGCVACAEHEEAVAGKCECSVGYARASDTGRCEAQVGSALGSACSESEPCSGANPYCAESKDGAFCTTRGCARNDDCPNGWRCLEADGEKYCGKPPSGFGMNCMSNADCEVTEAHYCETFQSHTCIVNGCAAHPADCPSQFVCCDLSTLIGQSLCVPSSTLMNGACPAGGMLIGP